MTAHARFARVRLIAPAALAGRAAGCVVKLRT
jgi:hypothetical protein